MRKLSRIIDRMEHTVLVWTIVGLAVIGFFQVIGRYLFNYSFTWFEELGRYLGVFLAFLGAGIGARKNAHFAMDLMVKLLDHPRRHFLQAATSLVSSGFFFTVFWYSGKMIARMVQFKSTSPTLGIPMYLAYLPILVFSLVLGIRFLRNGLGHVQQGTGFRETLPEEAP